MFACRKLDFGPKTIIPLRSATFSNVEIAISRYSFFPRVTGMSAKISISAQERENDLKSVPEQLVEVKNRIPGHISL